MEALFQILNEKCICKRPEPSDPLFFMVKNAIELWKAGSLDSSGERKSFWDSEQLSSPKNRKKRRLLLQTISTWFQRRRNKTGVSDELNLTKLNKWKEAIQCVKPQQSATTGKKHARYEILRSTSNKKQKKSKQLDIKTQLKFIHEQLKELKRENATLQLEVGLLKSQLAARNEEVSSPDTYQVARTCKAVPGPSVIPVLHRSTSHSFPHMDYFVDGKLECQHDAYGCCSTNNHPRGSFDVITDMEADEIARLLE